MATDAEVQAEKDKVDAMRQELADEQLAADQRARDRENDVTMASLKEEEALLQAQIDTAKAANVYEDDAPVLTAPEPPAPPPPVEDHPDDENVGGGF